jgi:hypothetical protein
MNHQKKKGMAFLFALSCSIAISAPAALAENPYLLQGIKEYYAGDYLNAAGHFGEAESADFNDAKLHYYLANTFVHLNQREAAIREYRIAYALEPNSEVGSLSKTALTLCSAEGAPAEKGTSAAGKGISLSGKGMPDDPLLKEALSRLHDATDAIKQNASASAENQATSIAKLSDSQTELLRKNTQDLIDDLRHIHSRIRGSLEDQARADGSAKQESMQRFYDHQRSDALTAGRKKVSAIDESANNLQQLLNEPAKPGHVKLSPTGTNLYVRNYEHPAAEPEQTKTK